MPFPALTLEAHLYIHRREIQLGDQPSVFIAHGPFVHGRDAVLAEQIGSDTLEPTSRESGVDALVEHRDHLRRSTCAAALVTDEGLTELDRFDPSHGTRLGSYAGWWIRQALQIAVAGQSYLISLPRECFRKLWTIERASEALANRGDRLPSAQELAERTGINLDLFTHLQTAARTAVSLDAVLHEDSEFQLAEAMADNDSTSELLNAERAEALQLLLENLLENLGPRERYVLDLRFGLAGNEANSLTQIGNMLGISKERVRQIQEAALNKIRTSADDVGWESSMLLD